MPDPGRKATKMTTISETIAYLYSQTAETIHRLKTEAYQATTDEKCAYLSPDGKMFRNERPDQSLMDAGWTYAKVKFARVTSYMSPRHHRWQEYRGAKRRATLLLAARLILKANNETVPAKSEMGPLLSMGTFRSHARTSGAQKSLAYAAYRLLRKLDNRLQNQPQRFSGLEGWLKQRVERRQTYV